MCATKKLVYINNPTRAEKLLVLLNEVGFEKVSSLRDIWRLRGERDQLGAVVLDTFGRFGLLGLSASWFLSLPLVCRLRGEFFREEWEQAVARKGVLRWPRYLVSLVIGRTCICVSEKVIVNSHYMLRAMGRYIKGKAIFVVYNPWLPPKGGGTNFQEFPDGRLNLLTMTNMNLYSKVGPIIEVLKDWITPKLFEEMDAYWIICGKGYHLKRIKELVTAKGLDSRVKIVGWQENRRAYLRWCDVMLHVTNIDAFPNSTMEAMMYSKPVITNTSSCGTLEQIVHGLNGFVIDGRESFMGALRAYSENPDLRGTHGAAGRRMVEEMFSVDKQREAMRAALQGLVD